MSDNNIDQKSLLFPKSEKSKQYLRALYPSFPFNNISNELVHKSPIWFLMGGQFYEDSLINKEMEINDIHNEYVDFISEAARYHKDNVHNKLNKNIYENIYANWNNLDMDVQKFYDTFLELYKNIDGELVRLDDYNNLPKNVPTTNSYIMKMNMDGGSSLLGKQITSIPDVSEAYWYTNNNNVAVRENKKTNDDLKHLYTCIFLNGNADICNKFNSPMRGGSYYNGFNVDINKISFHILNSINQEGNILVGGDSVFDSEENFNNYFLDCVLNNEVDGINNCVNFIKKTKINSNGKVDIEKANITLKNLGFTQNEHGIFENVSHWKNRMAKKDSLNTKLNNNNDSLLSHLSDIVNYINYVNYNDIEPETINNNSFTKLGLDTSWIPDFVNKQNNDTLMNLDIDKFTDDLLNQSGGRGRFPIPGALPFGFPGIGVPLGPPGLPYFGGPMPKNLPALPPVPSFILLSSFEFGSPP